MAEEGRRLKIPIGTDDFKKLRENGYYFVDKSELISDILQDGSEVFLFTRPRRFGKSLNLSMLDAFFNLKYKGNNWFEGLKINDHPEAEEHRNAYPVIRLSMNDLNYRDYDEFVLDFTERIRDLYKGFRYLENSELVDPADRTDYQDIIFRRANVNLIKKSLRALCSMLEQYHGIKPIILLDEYDNTLNHAYDKEPYQEIVDIYRSFYSLALKGNEHLAFAVVTGVMQIAKEGIFSGLNNLKVNNIFSVKFDERYGFTESEVEELCRYYGHPERFEEAKEWYDGYRFGNADIYNPWSILNYIDNDFVPDKYWAGTSGNDIIDTLLENANNDVFADLVALGNGDTVSRPLAPTVAMDDLKTEPNAIFSVLAVAGYLNAVSAEEGIYQLSIPNREMYSVFYDHIRKYMFRGRNDPYAGFLNALESGDAKKVQDVLYKVLSDDYPFLLLKDEGDYHLVLATMALSRKGRYEVSIDRESGNGRHDLLMRSRFPKYPNIAVEIKTAKTDSEAESSRLAHEALEQIKRKDYCKGLKGKTYLFGICFAGKKDTVLFEEILL